MYFLKYFEIVSFLIAINFDCSVTTPTDADDDEVFNALKACLTAVGPFIDSLPPVPLDHIFQRSNVSFHKYKQFNWQWNSVNGLVTPMAILWPKEITEIQQAIICCKKLNIRIVAKGGGMSYTKNGFGDNDSLVVDMSRFIDISTDAKDMTVEIGAGARHGLINYALWTKNFVLPLSSCPTVGITGYTLGGGFGYFTRMFGLASDSLISVDMIDANGRLVEINNSSHTFMWWALRGGGGGSFGIVTKLKFRIYQAPFSVIHGIYEYNLNDFPLLFYGWQTFVAETEELKVNNLGASLVLKGKQLFMETFYINLASDKQVFFDVDMNKYIDSIAFPMSTQRTVTSMTYTEFLLDTSQYYFDKQLTSPQQLNITRHNEVGWKKVKSFYVDKILENDGIKRLTALFDKYKEHGNFAFFQNGGAMNRFSRQETAFVHRNHSYDIQLWIYSPAGETEEKRQQMDTEMSDFYEKTKHPYIFGHSESFQNYEDGDISDAVGRYYQENLKKLITIKKNWDPNNTFHHRHSIPNDLAALDDYIVEPGLM